MSQEEADSDRLSGIVLRRRKKCGFRPGSTTKEFYEKREYYEEGEKIEKRSKTIH